MLSQMGLPRFASFANDENYNSKTNQKKNARSSTRQKYLDSLQIKRVWGRWVAPRELSPFLILNK